MFGSFSITGSTLGHGMPPIFRIGKSLLIFNVVIALLVTGCAKDDEADVRDIISAWIALKGTIYFQSQSGCTAALFRTDRVALSSEIVRVKNVPSGLSALQQGATVAFDVPDLSPSQVSEQITTANLAEGIGVISSASGGRRCMNDDMVNRFYGALTTPTAVLIFDTKSNALAVMRPELDLIFFTRGDV